MNILVCGASGFLGRHLSEALTAAGHTCRAGVRRKRQAGDVEIDFSRDLDPIDWLPKLAGVDIVVNAIGVLRDSSRQPMELLHAKAPAALYEACAQAGVQRVIHISALGVGSDLETMYFTTKEQGEQALQQQAGKLKYLILRPSLVYGEDGASARMFRFLAALPLHALPGGGGQLLQPVHIDDLVQACCNWLAGEDHSAIVEAAGSDVVSMRQMLDSYREQQGRGKAWHIPVPGFAVQLAAKVGDYISSSPLSSDNLKMLNAGSTTGTEEFAALLGRAPRSVHEFLKTNARP